METSLALRCFQLLDQGKLSGPALLSSLPRRIIGKAWAYHTCITILVGLVRQSIASISLLGKLELVQQGLVPTADPQKSCSPLF